MDAINKITASDPIQATKPVRPQSSARKPSPASRSDQVVLLGSTDPEKTAPALSLRSAEPPPQVERIREAVDSSIEQKRPLLAVLSDPSPDNQVKVDLMA